MIKIVLLNEVISVLACRYICLKVSDTSLPVSLTRDKIYRWNYKDIELVFNENTFWQLTEFNIISRWPTTILMTF